MPRRLRIGYARAVRMSGDGTTYAIAEQAAGAYVARKVAAGQASYAVAGQDAAFPSFFLWNAPSSGPSPTGYRLYWGTSPSTYPNGPHEDSGTLLQEAYSALGLAADTTYYVVVRAYNGAGEGANSNEIQVRNGVQVGP